jgi:hypothetical protein
LELYGLFHTFLFVDFLFLHALYLSYNLFLGFCYSSPLFSEYSLSFSTLILVIYRITLRKLIIYHLASGTIW